MKKRFKKIYIEITNYCNLDCDFCIKNKRSLKHITLEEFQLILSRIEPYTDYLYFHILGEPLMHPNINELIQLASKKFYINITTNGYLIDRIKETKHIRQLNISLHSFHEKYHISLDKYMKNIFHCIDQLIKNGTYISLRLWVKTPYYQKIISMINQKYHCNIKEQDINYKISDHLFVNHFHEFIWPDIHNQYYSEEGTCYGLKDHIGVLSDGTIVPCCLDTLGTISLGNIYVNELKEVIQSKRCQNMLKGFSQNKKTEELCKHCQFLDNSNKNM